MDYVATGQIFDEKTKLFKDRIYFCDKDLEIAEVSSFTETVKVEVHERQCFILLEWSLEKLFIVFLSKGHLPSSLILKKIYNVNGPIIL